MARPKTFDRDVALRKAMLLFWEQGYEATSTEELAQAMNIGRQSMYDTFGDKHSIFLEAMNLYRQEQGEQLTCVLADPVSPLRGIEALFFGIAAMRTSDRLRGCMFVNATTELPSEDTEALGILQENARACESAFENAIRRAQELGQLPAGLDLRRTGRFLFCSLQGLSVTAKRGASSEVLLDIAQFVLASLGTQQTPVQQGA